MSKWAMEARARKLWLRGIAIALTLIVIGHVMVLTVHDVENYPGIDLRVRVVGARLLIRGMNPYYDFRHEIHPPHLRLLSGDTFSPALLLLYAPLCEFDWRVQRVVYFAVDWIAMLLCYVVLARIFPASVSHLALWIAFVALFIADFGFRLHLERGQYYVELALLTAAASVYLFRKTDAWFHSLPLALLVLLRPTYVICILGVILLHRFRHAAYALVLSALLFAATLPFAGIIDWQRYFTSIDGIEGELLQSVYSPTPQPAGWVPGEVLEGIDFSKSLTLDLEDQTLIGVARGTVSPALARMVRRFAPTASSLERLNRVCLLCAFGFNVAVMCCFWRSSRPNLIAIAFVFLAPLNLELFAPTRFAYSDVTILAPLMLVLAASLEGGKGRGWVLYGVLLLVGFALPGLAFHFDKHVPIVNFSKYVVTVAILNLVCCKEAWKSVRSTWARQKLPDAITAVSAVAPELR